jgi:hypothetical protein
MIEPQTQIKREPHWRPFDCEACNCVFDEKTWQSHWSLSGELTWSCPKCGQRYKSTLKYTPDTFPPRARGREGATTRYSNEESVHLTPRARGRELVVEMFSPSTAGSPARAEDVAGQERNDDCGSDRLYSGVGFPHQRAGQYKY